MYMYVHARTLCTRALWDAPVLCRHVPFPVNGFKPLGGTRQQDGIRVHPNGKVLKLQRAILTWTPLSTLSFILGDRGDFTRFPLEHGANGTKLT